MGLINIVFDLHGVLINTRLMSEKYSHRMSELLHRDYHVPLEQGIINHKRAFSFWIKEFRSWDTLEGEPLKVRQDAALLKWTALNLGRNNLDSKTLLEYGAYLEFQIPSGIQAAYPETHKVLTTLFSSSKTIRMYIASSAHTRHIRGILQAHNYTDFFAGIFGLDSFWISKYNRRFYKKLADTLNIRDNLSLFIGNSTEEIVHSEKAGFVPVLIHREREIKSSLLNKTKYVFDALSDFLRHFHDDLFD